MVQPAEWMQNLETELRDEYAKAKRFHHVDGDRYIVGFTFALMALTGFALILIFTKWSHSSVQAALVVFTSLAVGLLVYFIAGIGLISLLNRVLNNASRELCRVVVHNQVGVEPGSIKAEVLENDVARATFTLYGIKCAFDPNSNEFSALWLERHVPSSPKLIDVLNEAHGYYGEKLAGISRLSSPQT